ncbi:MAG TPA: chemotaxis protein CheW [Rectinemataceae bacterium]|nr:chemotaxis protein CheW [Rectinemataceae bacterium]
MQYLSFRLNGVRYAVDVTIVETVVEDNETTAVPSPVEYMKGVMDLRDQVIPVINLRKKFGLEDSLGKHRASIIVARVDGGGGKTLMVGALVDEVSAVVDIDETSIEAARSEGAALWERYEGQACRHGFGPALKSRSAARRSCPPPCPAPSSLSAPSPRGV